MIYHKKLSQLTQQQLTKLIKQLTPNTMSNLLPTLSLRKIISTYNMNILGLKPCLPPPRTNNNLINNRNKVNKFQTNPDIIGNKPIPLRLKPIKNHRLYEFID